MSRLTYFTLALALAGCLDEELTSSSTEQEVGCPYWGCDENTPVMGPYTFWELNTNGLANNAGVRIVNFEIGGKLYTPRITLDARLEADSSTGTISGSQLEGGWLNVQTPTGAFKIIFQNVNVKASSIVKHWVAPAPIETYELRYTGPRITQGILCANPPSRDSGEGAGRVWEAPLEAMLFTGDRYSNDDKRVTHSTFTSTTGWFNIACAGSVLAKLHLNRHTSSGSLSTHTTTAGQRTAMLKMYVSDVCGTGKAWTVAGTPLHWTNNKTPTWRTLTGVETSFEARWGEQGAICMDTHRWGITYLDDMALDCGVPVGQPPVPPCNGNVAAPTFGTGYLVTANP